MINYATQLATDRNNNPLQVYPAPRTAFQTSAYAPPAVSSVVSFNPNTTMIEVTALNASLALKWGVGSVIVAAGATANFDHLIPVNQTRRFVIPTSVQGVASVVGMNAQAGLYNSMSLIATTSVLTAVTEY